MYFQVKIIFALTASIGVNAASILCHCKPSQSCWPTAQGWSSLNGTIGGNLVEVVPLASPCHDPKYDAAACAVVQANSPDSVYRSAQSGALQWQNWEASAEQSQQCYVDSPRSIPCGQGRVSLFSAEVETAAQIQDVVKFAVKRNIKLVIKNTGHDFLGRSSAPFSLQISTHKMKNMSVIDKFVPTMPSGASPPAGVKAVKLAAGVQQHELYAYLATQNTMVVLGSSNTVGAAGGYIQGGGHSLLGWTAGMASDNALEFTVVTAEGSLVTANAYQNTDLFFALRGGGGGTWGVVTSVTVKAHPDYPVIFTLTNYTLPTPDTTFWDGIEAFHNHLVALNDNGGTGYYYITPISPIAANQSVATFTLQMWFVNQTDTAMVTSLLSPLLTDLQNATGTTPGFRVIPFPTMTSMYNTLFTGSDSTGLLVQLGSRLISRSFVNSPGAPAKIARSLSGIKVGPADYIEGNVVAGGQVAANSGIDSALNPAWRKTVVHLLFTRQWTATTTFIEQAAIKANITYGGVPILKSFEPGRMGAYLNEADANESNFQDSFWGANYEKLIAIKSAWDPNGVFISRKGVGSESWDDQGNCRVKL
ncbi:hypothetical protein FE257_007074 [Aspergillus nanangensis]|uniref:FAD-binding PCMH-type domain-containing protein n=1 Tax=Aspergillus nanangensis TaxID=2582783 RepID=A0AAD4GVS0_ASPNN|nr:hypothetical protein FE257_007074 [Aspergillus nanangensis]